jgi:hypothetical protein
VSKRRGGDATLWGSVLSGLAAGSGCVRTGSNLFFRRAAIRRSAVRSSPMRGHVVGHGGPGRPASRPGRRSDLGKSSSGVVCM